MALKPLRTSRRLVALGAALLAALAASVLVVTLSNGSSHREAPLTSMDPTADDTDVYAFTAKDAPGALTVVANWLPFEDPGGGPNFFKFDPKARYYINVDNSDDARQDVRSLSACRPTPPATADAGSPVALPEIRSI